MKTKTFILLVLALLAATAHADITRETYVYAIKGADTLLLDTYVDTSLAPTDKRPVFMYVHGGGFAAGSRVNAAQEVLLRHMAEQGFLAVAPDYRLAAYESADGRGSNGKYAVQSLYDIVQIACDDVVDAVNFTLALTDLQPDDSCFIISGGSAGAITALTLEHDLCNEEPYTLRLPDGFNFAGIVSHAGAIDNHADSVMTWKHAPCPTLFFHGSDDTTVPFNRANVYGDIFVGTNALLDEWEQQGVSHWAFIIPGADHILALSPLTDNHEETDKFIREVVLERNNVNVYTEWMPEVTPSMKSQDDLLRFAPLYILGYGKYLSDLPKIQ